jgi:hypothetical protein
MAEPRLSLGVAWLLSFSSPTNILAMALGFDTMWSTREKGDLDTDLGGYGLGCMLCFSFTRGLYQGICWFLL